MKIYNTLTGKKDDFKPRKANVVNLFVCGPTVYDYSHLGHAKLFITFDCFAKYLKKRGYKVFYLQNITDIDDKIIARAREKKINPKNLAVAFEKEYLKDMKSLGITSVTKYARATDYIKEIISQVKRLQEKGFAYEIAGDGIYYDISKFADYGKLAGRTALGAEDAVSRIDYSKDKKNRGDFCLWKFKQETNEPAWPFGPASVETALAGKEGRPGWHIEDTAITEKFFGAQYDIHGGALELLFPHHQAEVAQMEALSGKKPMVKYWMHVGVLTVNGQKMSKSTGNFIVLSDFLKRCPANHLRFYAMKSLWSSPMDYSESTMIEIRSAVGKIEEFLSKIRSTKSEIRNKTTNSKLIKQFKTDFYKELDDDFNTPKAFAVMFDFIKNTNTLLEQNLISQKEAKQIFEFFEEINDIFGIIDIPKIKRGVPANIKKLVQDRENYRKNQEWEKSDKARDEIEKHGYTVKDTSSGPEIRSL